MNRIAPDLALWAGGSGVTVCPIGPNMELAADAFDFSQPTPAPAHHVGTGDFVLFQLSDGRLVRGLGPFARSSETPSADWVFYTNDFALGEPRPWLVPASVEVLTPNVEGPPGYHKPLRWKKPDPEPFRSIFADIMKRIGHGELRKAVPAAAERTIWLENDWREFLTALTPGAGGATFVCQLGRQGFAGRSPETLFQLQNGLLQTMALAGTAPAAQSCQLHENPKLLREHELVVEVLKERLSTLGNVSVGPRKIVSLGSMAHLATDLLAPCPEDHWHGREEALIRLLHPTPALGIAPRTPGTLELLHHYRAELSIPRFFGAPFGLKWPGGLEVLVAIRGVFWEDGEAVLPAGCGLVTGSEFESEWAELELKRRWVHQALNV